MIFKLFPNILSYEKYIYSEIVRLESSVGFKFAREREQLSHMNKSEKYAYIDFYTEISCGYEVYLDQYIDDILEVGK